MSTKLSAYIRKGALLRPQAFHDYVKRAPLENGWQYEYRTCAIGGAYEAITGKLPEPDWLQHGKVNKTIFQATGVKDVRIPYPESVLPEREAPILDVVSTLNDTSKWTREQIADYLETQGY